MTGVIQTWDPTYGLPTQKQPIFFVNVPKTVRKGSCVRAESTIQDHTRQGTVSGPVGWSGRSWSLRISTRRYSHGGVSILSWTWISSSRFLLGDFRDRVRDFARSNHSSRGLVLPTSRPTTVSITPQRYPESPGSSRIAHGAAHGASRRTAPTMLLAHLGREIRFCYFKSTLHYSPRLFPTPPSCKRVGTSPASPGTDLILVAGKKCSRGRLGAV